MKITLHYFGQLRQLAHREIETVEIEGAADPVEILRRVAPKYDEMFARILFDDHQKLAASVMILINQEMASRDSATPLRDGDEISLISAICGG